MRNVGGINQVESFTPPVSELPARRTLWPREAREAYGEVLSELNSWCRDLERSFAGNAWIAENAVREAWRTGEPANTLAV